MSESKQVKYNININLIATRKYHIFVNPLIDSICRYFLLRHDIQINLFTDETSRDYFGDKRVKIVKHYIPSYGFPEATLYRYAVMKSIEYDCDYIYYLDVDYLVVSEIDEEILGDLVAVLHPGFSCVGGGSWCNDTFSNAYIPDYKRKFYACGGTQGGSKEEYYNAMATMDEGIYDDERRGFKAEWNDEAHWNKYLSNCKNVKILDSSYCFVQQPYLQKLWKIDHLTPKILALEKDHESIRK